MTDHNDGQEFNDDELQEIMGEIESLEQEFGDEASGNASDESEELDLAETERQLKELEDSVEDEDVDDSKDVEVEVEEVHAAEEHYEEASHNDALHGLQFHRYQGFGRHHGHAHHPD